MREKTTGWLAVITYQRTMVLRIPRTATAGHVATNISAALIAIILKIQQSMPDSKALNPVSGKKPFKRSTPGPSSLDRILDRSCQIHGTPDKPANHTNRDCWVFKQAGKLNAENRDKGLHSDEDEEPRPSNNRDRRASPHKCGR